MYSFEDLVGGKGPKTYEYAKGIIPGGTQLLSKRQELYAPSVWPTYFSRAKGCRIWDLDEREFVDMSTMGVGACILGYADEEVDDAVMQAIKRGVTSSLNAPEEVYLAEALIDLHPWFGMVRYARSGGEAMAVAVRIARAHSGRDKILFSGYHGWNDWYLAANLVDDKNLDTYLIQGLKSSGIPKGLINTAIPFELNSIESLHNKIKGQEKEIAAIIIEPARGADAPKDYLMALREFASEIGAVLIFDEITSGFRMCAGGIHKIYEVHPDIAVFAKSMANGYAMAAILGKENVMQSAQNSFISSTNWTERIGPSAALATLTKYKRDKVDRHITTIGEKVKTIWLQEASKHNLNVKISGLPSLASFSFVDEYSTEISTKFTIEMLKKGFLAFKQFKPSLAHNMEEIQLYKIAISSAFKNIADNRDSPLTTPLQHEGFQRLTPE